MTIKKGDYANKDEVEDENLENSLIVTDDKEEVKKGES